MKSIALNEMQATLRSTTKESFAYMPPMDQAELREKIGNAIRTVRKQRGYSMRQVGEAAGVSAGAVGNWERGANDLTVANLRAVASFLRVEPVALGRGDISYLDPEEPISDAEIVTDMGPIPNFGPLDVEIMGIAAGGDDGDFSFNGEVTGYVRRPPGISHLRNVFAVHVISDSMVPKYEPSDLLYLHSRTAVPGDYVVVEKFPEGDEKIGKCFVKRLDRRTASELRCWQFNPPKEVIFNAYEVKNVWRIIPTRELLGY
jgi:phage repressor protein C with HTH and peptisase S24 domain